MNNIQHKIHRALAVFLGLFVITHIAVHLVAVLGIETHIWALSYVQVVYRNILVEPILVLAILAQVYTGIGFVVKNWKYRKRNYWIRVQLISGVYLAAFMLFHFSAALLTRFSFNLDTNFFWAAGTLVTTPFVYFFIPYYFFAVVAFFSHIGALICLRGGDRNLAIGSRFMMFGVAASIVILLTFTGSFYDIDLPSEYIGYFDNYKDLLGL